MFKILERQSDHFSPALSLSREPVVSGCVGDTEEKPVQLGLSCHLGQLAKYYFKEENVEARQS